MPRAGTCSESLEGLLTWRRSAQSGSRGPWSLLGQPVGQVSWNGRTVGGVRGWLRLAGGDNAIGMIQGDLVGSGRLWLVR